MRQVDGLTIRLFGREYALGVGRWARSGAPALMLINRASGAVLPVGFEGTVKEGEAMVPDVDGILPTLVAAGVVKVIGASERGDPFKLRRCEIVHVGLLNALAQCDKAKEGAREHDRGGHGR